MSFTPHVRYLPEIDILDVEVREGTVARTLNLGHWRNIDLDAEGRVLAVEFINVSTRGVDLTNVPERETIERLIRDANIALPV